MTVVPDIQTRPPDDEQAPDDGAVMDAYSRVVTTVARRLTPAVASLRVMVSVPGGRRPAGAGSAVVVTPDGFLLTSAHVVGGSSGGVAGFSDGRELEFEVVGADPLSDMAVIRVAAGPAKDRFGKPLTQGEIGNLSRNFIRQPSTFNNDIAIFKNVKIGERREIQLRWEVYNIFNHVNFSDINGSMTFAPDSAVTALPSTGVCPAGTVLAYNAIGTNPARCASTSG